MSRIGKSPIPVPSGVDVSVADRHITIKGPKGTLERDLPGTITVRQEGEQLLVERPTDERQDRAMHGLVRSLVNNMVVGVTDGYEKKLEIVGVGYRVQARGQSLEFSLGFSHLLNNDLLGRLRADSTDDFLVVERFAIDGSVDRSLFTINREPHLGLVAVVSLGGRHERGFNRPKHDILVDALLSVQRINDPQQIVRVHSRPAFSSRPSPSRANSMTRSRSQIKTTRSPSFQAGFSSRTAITDSPAPSSRPSSVAQLAP